MEQLEMSLFKNLKNTLRLFRDDMACAMLPSALRNECAVIRMDAIGDYMLWRNQGSFLCKHLKSRGLRTVLIANDVWSELASSDLPFDEVLSVNRNRFRNSVSYRFQIMRSLRRWGFCEVYNASYSRDLLVSDSLVRSCGSPVSVGFNGDYAIRSRTDCIKGDSWYTKLIPAFPGQLHELQRNCEFVNAVAGTTASTDFNQENHRHSSEPSYFVIAPGAAWKGRQWPVANYIEIAGRILTNRPGWRCVVVGSREEHVLAEIISRSLPSRIENMAGKTKLSELVKIVSTAKFVIANESATGHIAAMYNTPSVVILGGGHFGRFMPYPDNSEKGGILPPKCIYNTMDCFGCNWKCIYRMKSDAVVPCIEHISTESVWKAVAVLLAFNIEPLSQKE